MKKWLLLSFFLSACAPLEQQSTVIPVYTYVGTPPFASFADSDKGLSTLFVDFMNKLDTRYRYQLINTSKQELLKKLEAGEQGLILWPNLKMYPAHLQLEASKTLFLDSAIVVSKKASGIDYTSPESLIGHSVCTRHKFVIPPLEPLVAQGKISKLYTDSHEQCFALLDQQKTDSVTIAKSHYLNKYRKIKGYDHYVANKSIYEYSRHILVTPQNRHLIPNLDSMIDKIKRSEEWQAVLLSLGEQEFYDMFQMSLTDLKEVEVN